MTEIVNLGLNEISKIIQKFQEPKVRKDREWRNRDAVQIIRSGYSNGCSDDAVLFKQFTELSGIPTFFVETLEKRWLESRIPGTIKGHVFCDVILDDRTAQFDPRNGETRIENGYYLRKSESEKILYVPVAKGLDFSNMYVIKDGRYGKQSTSIKTIEELQKVIESYSSLTK